jgi:hypothetical protein
MLQDDPAGGGMQQEGVRVALKQCPDCNGSLADDSHPAAAFEDDAHYAKPSPGHPCRCEELRLLGLMDRQNSGDNELTERRRGERRSSHIRRRGMCRRASERRVSTPSFGVDSRSGVARRAGGRRTNCDQRWGTERRAYTWLKEHGEWMIAGTVKSSV